VQRLPTFTVAHTPLMPAILGRLLHIDRSAIVHVHISHAFAPEMVWLAAKVKGFRYIAHVHLDSAPSGRAGFLLKLYKPLALKAVLRAARLVVVFTPEQRTELQRQYGIAFEKIQVVPNGVEKAFMHDQARALHEKPRLLFVGRLSIQKNLPLFLHALQGVSDHFETTIVGEGDLEQESRKLANELNLQNVSFVGRAEGQRLLEIYRTSDIFVLPSEREGMPLVLLEAMAMGLPIVATNVTGNRDVVVDGANGLLVPLGDPSAFRSALLHIVADGALYQRMSKASREMAGDYVWEKVVAKFEDLYREVAVGR
jgi:glycosyltransferase involved in cell wall biosynthesis